MSKQFQREVFKKAELETVWAAHCTLVQPAQTTFDFVVLVFLNIQIHGGP